MNEHRLDEIEKIFATCTDNPTRRALSELGLELVAEVRRLEAECADWYERAQLAQGLAGELKEEIRRLRALVMEANSPLPPQQKPEPLPAPRTQHYERLDGKRTK